MEDIITWTDNSPLSVRWMKLLSQQPEDKKFNYQMRRIRNPTKEQETCINTVGSFQCVSSSQEYVGIGWGGESPCGGCYRSEFTVLTARETTCMDHKIPDLGGRIAPMITTIRNWLFVCGGDYTSSCMKLDMNADNPSWSSFVSLPWAARHGTLETHGDYMYAMGGYNSGTCYNYHYRISATGTAWEVRAGYPINIHRHRAVVDNTNGRIYSFGGDWCGSTRHESYYYTVSDNTWTGISGLPWGAKRDVAAAVIKQKNEEEWIVLMTYSHNAVYYWNLETNQGFYHIGNSYDLKNDGMFMLAMTPYTGFLVGGWTNKDHVHLINWWVYNSEKKKFEKVYRYLQNNHRWGYWTRAATTYRALHNCRAERTYAALGWGGRNVVSRT